MDHVFTMPADLAATIAASRARWAGWTMLADDTKQASPAEQAGSEATSPAPEQPAQPDGETPLGDAGKKALDAERKARRDAERQLAAANQQLQQIADQGKTDLELATERAAKAEQQLAVLQHNQLRMEVATAKGLPASAAMRLQGATREELEADAVELAALISAAPQAPTLRLGGQPPKSTTNDEGRSFVRALVDRN